MGLSMKYIIEKASVKPYTRVRQGKFEHVKGYDISRMTQGLDRPVGLASGRERHVMISELAKRGYRYLGDANYEHEQADPFLMESYGIKSVKKIAIPFRDGHMHTAWIGRPTNKTGRAEMSRLAKEKLPFVGQYETLPKKVEAQYVSGQETERFPEVSYKGANYKLVNKKGEWSLRITGWDKPLDPDNPNYHFERLARESAKTYQKYVPLGMGVDKFSKEFALSKLYNMGYTKKQPTTPSLEHELPRTISHDPHKEKGLFERDIQESSERWKTRGAIKTKDDLPDFMQKYYRPGVAKDEFQMRLPYGIAIKTEDKPVIERATKWLKENGAEWKFGGVWVFKVGLPVSLDVTKSFLEDARKIINSQRGATAEEKHKGMNMVLDVLRNEEEYDGENTKDDSKDSKAFHKDLFDVEDDLLDFIQTESKKEQTKKVKEEVKKSGGGVCPHDGKRGVYLRRYYQVPYWIREYKCPSGHIFQEIQ